MATRLADSRPVSRWKGSDARGREASPRETRRPDPVPSAAGAVRKAHPAQPAAMSMRLRHIGAMLALIFFMGCQPEDEMDPIEKKLLKLREVAIAYLENERPEKWEVHVAELRRGAVMHLEGVYRIGRWMYDDETSTLIRDADIAPLTVRYGMRFERTAPMQFRVSGDFWERERLDFSE
jgi:hypothetical protein